MQTSAVKYRSFSTRRSYGVELEINNTITKTQVKKAVQGASEVPVRAAGGWDQSIANSYWHIKTDATCGIGLGVGWEVASYKCSGYKDLLHLGEVATAVKKAGAKTNRSCGLHVHVEVADFTVNQIGTLLAWWLKLEPILLAAVPAYRTYNVFAWPMRTQQVIDKLNGHLPGIMPTPFTVWNIFRPESVDVHDNPYRHYSLNLVNYLTSLYDPDYQRMTLEFRLPECNLAVVNVVNWPRLFVNFVEYCKNQPMPKNLDVCNVNDALTALGLHHDDSFCIFSHGLMKTKTWFLKRVIKYCRNKKQWGEQAKQILNLMYEPEKSFK